MARKTWRRSEKNYIIENYETKTTEELCEHLKRNRKSVNRMIEKLRDEELIGYRDQGTINRAYRQRKRGKKGSLKKRKRTLSYDTEYEEV